MQKKNVEHKFDCATLCWAALLLLLLLCVLLLLAVRFAGDAARQK